ncbi:MAG: NADAR family protein [Cytophagales bacterium]|nr:MAG: NADAR family protein [Cytophagales bacterium]
MKYSLDWLIENDPNSKIFLLFWGHQPHKSGKITSTCLSQWWLCNFMVQGVQYNTAEHWMMAEKARLFKDFTTLEKILTAPTPKDAKALGRKVSPFDGQIWSERCYDIVVEGNFHKFSQNEPLQNFLLETQNAILVEASPYDKIWGIGLSAADPNSQNPAHWQGKNLLGFALMEVRDRLMQLA